MLQVVVELFITKVKKILFWRIKAGLANTASGGNFDRLFEEYLEYVANTGTFYECNGQR